MKHLHHITVGGTPLCDWLGCPAGQQIAERAQVRTCTAVSGAEARRMAARLQPAFMVPVRAVRGDCPSFANPAPEPLNPASAANLRPVKDALK